VVHLFSVRESLGVGGGCSGLKQKCVLILELPRECLISILLLIIN
jgi:hypothetical protein